jgi:hypothetical protein
MTIHGDSVYALTKSTIEFSTVQWVTIYENNYTCTTSNSPFHRVQSHMVTILNNGFIFLLQYAVLSDIIHFLGAAEFEATTGGLSCSSMMLISKRQHQILNLLEAVYHSFLQHLHFSRRWCSHEPVHLCIIRDYCNSQVLLFRKQYVTYYLLPNLCPLRYHVPDESA